jgi:hypothetical protein
LDFEEEARELYAAVKGVELMPGGFVPHRSIAWFGASPDAFVGHDGLLETKCPRTTTHIDYMLAGVVPDFYKPQMLAQLACTGRKWCDFASYDPRIQDPKRRLFVRRFTPTPAAIEDIENAARQFLAEVEAMWEILTTTEPA